MEVNEITVKWQLLSRENMTTFPEKITFCHFNLHINSSILDSLAPSTISLLKLLLEMSPVTQKIQIPIGNFIYLF